MSVLEVGVYNFMLCQYCNIHASLVAPLDIIDSYMKLVEDSGYCRLMWLFIKACLNYVHRLIDIYIYSNSL